MLPRWKFKDLPCSSLKNTIPWIWTIIYSIYVEQKMAALFTLKLCIFFTSYDGYIVQQIKIK